MTNTVFVVEVEQQKVVEWRFEQFRAMGFAFERAWELAASPVDYRSIRHLIDLGCESEVAVEIVR